MHVSRNAVFMVKEMYFQKNQAQVVENDPLIGISHSLNNGNLVRIILGENSNHSNDDSLIIEEPQDILQNVMMKTSYLVLHLEKLQKKVRM